MYMEQIVNLWANLLTMEYYGIGNIEAKTW